MFKALLVIVSAAFVIGCDTANASLVTPAWAADGYREVGAANSVTVTYMPFRAENFDSQARCESFIDEQNAMLSGRNVKGYAQSQRVVATCSQQR